MIQKTPWESYYRPGLEHAVIALGIQLVVVLFVLFRNNAYAPSYFLWGAVLGSTVFVARELWTTYKAGHFQGRFAWDCLTAVVPVSVVAALAYIATYLT